MLQTCAKCGKQYYGVGCPDCDYPPTAPDPGQDKRNWVLGVVFMAAGVSIGVRVLAWPQKLPSWPGLVAGVLFFLAGMQIIAKLKGRLGTALGGVICAGLASLGFFAAFGPGPVEGGIPLLPAAWNQALGKTAFGGGACLVAALAVWCFYRAAKPGKKKGGCR
jgi:hypothetical protein